MEELKFVLFIPLSISADNNSFYYEHKVNTYYPYLLGVLGKNNECIDVITGKEYNIVSENIIDVIFKIKEDTKIINNPAVISKNIENTLDNLKFIEKYINRKGYVRYSEINKYPDFAYLLNNVMVYQNDSISGYYFPTYYPLVLQNQKKYLNIIENENKKAINNIFNIQTSKNETVEKKEIISRIRKKLF